MINAILFMPVILSFFVVLFLLPNWIKRAKKQNLVGKDIHKIEETQVAESGGINVVSGFALGVLAYIAINTFIFKSNENFIEVFALLTTILLISFIAFTDDILGWKIGLRRRTRLILVAFASIPLVAINAGKSIIYLPFFGVTDVGILYPLVLIPIGIVGATTTFNFLAGYNGLEAGQGIIILIAIAIITYLTKNSWLALIVLCMIAALLAFIFYNFYPAKVFPGDSLTYSVGSLIAIVAILGNFERIAVFFFIPYILEVILKLRGGLIKQSFAIVQPDSSLKLRYEKIYSLNHLAIFLMQKLKIKPTEVKTVLAIWLFQIVVIVIGFIIFWHGIVRNG